MSGNIVPLRQRDPYLKDIERMLATDVDEPSGTQLAYACADREAAGKLSRRLRAEVKRRGWRATVKQFRRHVYIWKNLTADEETIVRRRIGQAAASLAEVPHLRPVRGPWPRDP